jgi:hypothetical protein
MPEFIRQDPIFNPFDLEISQVGYLLVPGRGRQNNGTTLTIPGEARVTHAAEIYHSGLLPEDFGKIVVSGYKTPAEQDSEPWTGEEVEGEYEGIPEAVLMYRSLVRYAVPRSAIAIEPDSTTTINNFARCEADGYFGDSDDRPVGIIAQRDHLKRMVAIIAPHILRRKYVGIPVPEVPGHEDSEGLAVSLLSRIELLGIRPDTPDLRAITERRSHAVWKGVLAATRLKAALTGSAGFKYHTGE